MPKSRPIYSIKTRGLVSRLTGLGGGGGGSEQAPARRVDLLDPVYELTIQTSRVRVRVICELCVPSPRDTARRSSGECGESPVYCVCAWLRGLLASLAASM